MEPRYYFLLFVVDDDGNPSEVKTLCHPELIISNENEDQKHDRKSI